MCSLLTEHGIKIIAATYYGPAALMFIGAVVLLTVEVTATGLISDANSWRSPGLLLVTLVTLAVFIPVPLCRAITARPQLQVTPAGLRYGRFAVRWAQVGQVRLVNGAIRVEVGAREGTRRFPLDNRLASELMRGGLGARGSWLSGWMDVSVAELADWLEQERRVRQGLESRQS